MAQRNEDANVYSIDLYQCILCTLRPNKNVNVGLTHRTFSDFLDIVNTDKNNLKCLWLNLPLNQQNVFLSFFIDLDFL